MKYFVPGKESREVVDLILSLVRVENDDQKEALYQHLCDGKNVETVCLLRDIQKSNFRRTLARVAEVFEAFEKLFEIKYRPVKKKPGPRVVDTRPPGIHPPNINN